MVNADLRSLLQEIEFDSKTIAVVGNARIELWYHFYRNLATHRHILLKSVVQSKFRPRHNY